MERIEVFPQNIVDTKTIMLKARLDSNMARKLVEELKSSLFVRFGFLRPRGDDIMLVSLSKYYEHYTVIGGKYSIDYCKKHDYAIGVEEETREIFIDGKKYNCEQLAQGERSRVIRLVGEEHSNYQSETYVVLDRSLQEVSPKKLFLAPVDYELGKEEARLSELGKNDFHLEEEIKILRSRIVKRPLDVEEVIKEVFEITDRTVVYKPIYELIFLNAQNGKKVTALVDGITGEVALERLDYVSKKLAERSYDELNHQETFRGTGLSQNERQQIQTRGDSVDTPKVTVEQPRQNPKSEPEPEISHVATVSLSVGQSSPERASSLAVNFLKKLGYRRNLRLTKLSQNGEDYVVEADFDKGIAKVQVDAKTGEVKEYELQENEKRQFSSLSKGALLILIFSVVAVVSLKLLNLL